MKLKRHNIRLDDGLVHGEYERALGRGLTDCDLWFVNDWYGNESLRGYAETGVYVRKPLSCLLCIGASP